MTTTLIKGLTALAHPPGAPSVRALFEDEVSDDGLVQYYNGQATLGGGSFAQAFYDRKGNVWREILGTGTAAWTAAGIQITGAAFADMANMDLSVPFTLMLAVTPSRADPNGASTVRVIGAQKASLGSGSGFYLAFWGNANRPGPTAFASVHAAATLNGVGEGVTANLGVDTANWGEFAVIFSTHLGGGQFRNEVWRGGGSHGRPVAWNLTDLTTPGGAVQPVRLGASLTTQMGGAAIIDGFAHWARPISYAEKVQAERFWREEARRRGRPMGFF